MEPQYSQTYTFYTLTDDGVRLWVNGQLIIDKWIDQGPTEWSGQIALTAGQRYDIVMEFYENGGGATAKLSWSSASQPKQIIPQSRLYPPGSSSQVAFEWLVADQLGTPRMVFDKTGSLAATKRHDYLPFGEELFAGVGGRTTALGYAGDMVRQKFTLYERDNETGLDFAQARYFAHVQGRFTGVDPLLASGRVSNPQTWNRYAYGLNNPLRYVDPTGMDGRDIGTAEDQKRDQQPPPPQAPTQQTPAQTPPSQPQVLDLRADPTINHAAETINANAVPLPKGERPELSGVVVVEGETSTLQNGTIIDMYGNALPGFTGTVRPVAYIPLDQSGNIIPEGNGVVVSERVETVGGEEPTITPTARAPRNGIFIDIQSIPSDTPTTSIRQVVTVSQGNTRFRVGPNQITKDAKKRQISVTLGTRKKL